MHIRMLKSFTYPYGPGGITRTLPEGQTFNEPVEIAEAAIAEGCAERIDQIKRESVLISEEVDDYLDPQPERAADADPAPASEPEPVPSPEPSPEPAPAAETGRRGKKASGEVAPAETVDPA